MCMHDRYPLRCLSSVPSTENAMSFVHSCGYVHRDIKPENCFIKTDDTSFQLKLGFVHSRRRHWQSHDLYLSLSLSLSLSQTVTLDTRRPSRNPSRRFGAPTCGQRPNWTGAAARLPRAMCTALVSLRGSYWPGRPTSPGTSNTARTGTRHG